MIYNTYICYVQLHYICKTSPRWHSAVALSIVSPRCVCLLMVISWVLIARDQSASFPIRTWSDSPFQFALTQSVQQIRESKSKHRNRKNESWRATRDHQDHGRQENEMKKLENAWQTKTAKRHTPSSMKWQSVTHFSTFYLTIYVCRFSRHCLSI